MKIIDPSYEILTMPAGKDILKQIEVAGRTCYKSEHKITDDSAQKFVTKVIRNGHHSVLEHAGATVRFVCDRGVTHEVVRHRLAAYSQESTRYANYSGDKFGKRITVVRPYFWDVDSNEYAMWKSEMISAESHYMALLKAGARPEQARSVLPNSLKAEIVMTCNFREWRHVLSLRCARDAHPQIRQIMRPLLGEFFKRVPAIFQDVVDTIVYGKTKHLAEGED